MLPKRAPKPTRNKRVRPRTERAPRGPSRWSVDWGRMRLWAVGIFFSLIWCALWARAYQLQIIRGPELAEMAKRQHTANEVLMGMRGNITDRNGNILARSVDCQSVWVNPSQIENPGTTAGILSKCLDMPANKILPLLRGDRKFVWVRRKISDKAARQVKEAALPGVFLASEFDRLYPYEHLAGQLVGFVNVDEKGIEGMEQVFDTRLAGQRVRQIMQRDAAGRRMVLQGSEDPGDLRGQDIRLTIDSYVQSFAEKALEENVEKFGARWGGCIVVDVPTGEVLAWAQYPFFNPNRYKDYSSLQRRNRLAMDALEQGSTIKSFLIAAALEEKVVSPSTVINCEKGKWKLRTATIHDTHPYSSLTVDKVLHVSSNIGAAKIGMKLGSSRYHTYLARLGFGTRPDLPLAGGAKGILRPAQQWREIDLAASSFGQSFSATLAQMAQAYLCIAGDGVKRSLVLVMPEPRDGEEAAEDTPVPTGEAVGAGTEPPRVDVNAAGVQDRIFSPETMKIVRSMMREVVEEEGGTGSAARIPGIEVGGKTGTAQKADRSGKYGSGRVGSFVGMVPIDKPRYLICVLLDEPEKNQYGGVIAAPVFRYVGLRTMAYYGLLPDSDDPLVVAAEKEAAKKNRGRKEDKQLSGKRSDSVVAEKAQEPAPARRIVPPDSVPDVVGMSVRQAVEAYARHGIVPDTRGTGGFVARQAPDAGAAWPADGKGCTLWLEERML